MNSLRHRSNTIRIISSKTHDYYDSIQRIDQNRELIYNRIEQEICIQSPFKYPNPLHRIQHHCTYDTNVGYNIVNYIVGFCGQIHPLLWLKPYDYDSPGKFCYNIEDVDWFMQENFKEECVDMYYDRLPKWKKHIWSTLQRNEFRGYFTSDYSRYEDLFIKHKTPMFSINNQYKCEKYHLIINPVLKDVEFYRIVDAYTAYQEISMFLANQLVGLNKPIPEMSDETKSQSHGFDKYSFRKEKKVCH